MPRLLHLSLVLVVVSGAALADDGDPPAGLSFGDGQRYPLSKIEVKAKITGPVARVNIRQHFENPYEEAVGVIYTFPLPDGAAIDDFRAQIGRFIIRSEVMERSRANEKFQRAEAQGQAATIIQQIRPNLFTQRISIIPRGESIVVEITYIEELKYEGGGYQFLIPVVAGPRYAPTPGDETAYEDDPGHSLELEVEIDAGVNIWDITSTSHSIEVTDDRGRNARVTLDPTDTLPNKDFELAYKVSTDETEPALFAHRTSAGGYFSLLIHPDEDPTVAEVWARELIFVIDCSGSMAGMPNETAKAVVKRTLRTLRPSDTFQILRFSDRASGMRPFPVPATYENIQEGLRFVSMLSGSGGTQMISGIRLALEGRRDPERIRIVHFITDGLIGNEPEILKELKRLAGDARVFPLGVGTSVNRFLIERMAELGKGTASYIRHDAPEEFIKAEVDKFVSRVRTPVVTDLDIDWGGLPVSDVVPARLPDSFRGRPVLIHGRYNGPGEGTVILRGRQGGGVYRRDMNVVLPEFERSNSALGKLWARARIQELMLGKYGGDQANIDREVTELALEHNLLTDRTAFVAVDEVTSGTGTRPRRVTQPSPWPQGVGGGDFFGIILGDVHQNSYLKPVAATPPTLKPPLGSPGPSRITYRKNDALPGFHLLYLSRYQGRTGVWKARGDLLGDVGVTALSLLAHHASGTRPGGDSLFGKSVYRGLRYLDRVQTADGTFGPGEGNGWVLDHALATLAVLEYLDEVGHRRARLSAGAALHRLIGLQSCGLGWSRDDSTAGGDTLTTAIVACVFTRAKKCGFALGPAAPEGIRKWFYWATDADTGFVRMTLHSDPFEVDGLAIACGMLARRHIDKQSQDHAVMMKGAKLLLDLTHPVGDESDPLHLFITTAAMRHMGGKPWTLWRPPLDESMRKAIVPKDERDDAGNPNLVGREGMNIGRSAAMALFGMTRSLYEPRARPFTMR